MRHDIFLVGSWQKKLFCSYLKILLIFLDFKYSSRTFIIKEKHWIFTISVLKLTCSTCNRYLCLDKDVFFVFLRSLFTSIPFAESLLKHDLTLVGSLIGKTCQEIPNHMKCTPESCDDSLDYRVLYQRGGKLSLHSWVDKRCKGKR